MTGPLVRSPSIPSAIGLVVANLVPLIGVIWFGWSLYGVMWLYWAENGVVGLYALARILSTGDTPIWKAIPLGAFFVVHFGGFWAVHGVFVRTLFGSPGDGSMGWAVATEAAPIAAVVPLAASHGVSFVMNYLIGGEWRGATLSGEMIKPYGRVVILHLVILLGGWTILAVNGGLIALVLLVVLKTALDLGIHWVAHGRRYADLDTEAPETPGRTLYMESLGQTADRRTG